MPRRTEPDFDEAPRRYPPKRPTPRSAKAPLPPPDADGIRRLPPDDAPSQHNQVRAKRRKFYKGRNK